MKNNIDLAYNFALFISYLGAIIFGLYFLFWQKKHKRSKR